MPNALKIPIGIFIAIIAIGIIAKVGLGFSTMPIAMLAAFVYVVLTEILEVLVYKG